MIRVFPRKTKWTPNDDLAFIGDPPMFMPEGEHQVRVSCVFTWDIEESERLVRSWSRFYSDVKSGGPAYDCRGDEFKPGLFVKDGVTFTSRGCSKDCKWCFVPRREGWIRELPIRDGWDVADNNLLACSHDHVEAVFEMLKRQANPIKFSGGLDCDMIQPWHIDLLKSIRLKYAWFACDYPGAVSKLERTADLMSDFSREKKRCYVLIGFNGESPCHAESRLKTVYRLGFLPMAMLYQPSGVRKAWYSPEWLRLRRTWSRPAAFKAEMAKECF